MRRILIGMVMMMVWAVVLEAHAGCTTTIPGSSGGLYSDEDCDGIAGKIDQCDKPDKIGPDGILGLDTDTDGIWDACDNCPTVANPLISRPASTGSRIAMPMV